METRITIASWDAAAMNDPEGTAAAAVADIAAAIRAGVREGTVRDANGNRIGTWSFDRQPEERER